MTLEVLGPAGAGRHVAVSGGSLRPCVLEHLTEVLLTHSTSQGSGASVKGSNSAVRADNAKRHRRSGVGTEVSDNPRVLKAGSRRYQRFLNVKSLMDLGLPEDELDWSYVTPTNSHFTDVVGDPNLADQWREFINSSEDAQRSVLEAAALVGPRRRSMDDYKSICRESDPTAMSPEKCFNRLDRRLRTLYRKSHIPFGAVEAMEKEMLAVFQDNPAHVLVWKLENSYFRAILHGICQFHNLKSCSENAGGERRTRVTNPAPTFTPSPVPLFEFVTALTAHA